MHLPVPFFLIFSKTWEATKGRIQSQIHTECSVKLCAFLCALRRSKKELTVYSYEADPLNGVYVDPLNGAMLTPLIIDN